MADSVGRLDQFRSRYHVTGQVAAMLMAGAVALIVLVAAVVALPRSATKHTSAVGSAATTEGTVGNVTSGSSTPGSGSAGNAAIPATSGGGGSASGSTSGNGTRSVAGQNKAHVSSRFLSAKAPGITDTTIYVGVGYSSQSAAGDKAIGAAGAAPSYDYRNVFNTAVNYANSHGGFAGRKMQALYYDYNLTDDTNTQEQSACAFFTQDNKVFAMDAGDDILNSCAERKGALPIGGGATLAQYKKYPHLIHPDAIRLDRLGHLTVSGLYKAKYFTGKLGLVTWDDPNYREAVRIGYLGPLAQLGIKPAQVAYIMVPQTLGALGDMTAATNSAVAKFKSANIDHVIVQDGGAGVFGGTGLTLEWMNAAKSQRYYPRYGQNAANSPGWSVLPSDQMDHAIAVDHSDYDKSKDAGASVNQTRENCFKIMADAGYPVNSSNANDEVFAGLACDFAFFMQRVMNNSLSQLTADGFVNAAQQLGTSFKSAVVYGTKLVPGRRDGGGMVRTEEYFDSCKCLKYKTAPAYGD